MATTRIVETVDVVLFVDPEISCDLELRAIRAKRSPNGLNLVRPIEASSLLPHHTPPACKRAS